MFYSGFSSRKNIFRQAILATWMITAVIAVSGCAEIEKELATDDTLLLNRANNYYARERFVQSTESYRRLVERYPDSKYRKTGLVGLADSLYKEGQFEESILYYERFVDLYPMDELTPRALFYYGMSHMMLTSNPERNQEKTKMAKAVFTEFIVRYPDHELTTAAGWYKDEMSTMISENRMEIARFYYRTKKNSAAISRLMEFVKNYPKSPYLAEAMYMLGHSFMREQSYKNAAEIFTMLIGAHPNTEWAAMAKQSAGKLVIKSN